MSLTAGLHQKVILIGGRRLRCLLFTENIVTRNNIQMIPAGWVSL